MSDTTINLTPDSIVFCRIGPFTISGTIVFSWIVMGIIVVVSILATMRLKRGPDISRRQALLEAIVGMIRDQITTIMHVKTDDYIAFPGTLFLFISISNLLDFIPGYSAPTASLYTTGALAVCVFFAVPYYGIRSGGFSVYFKKYITPNPLMLPFNIISEISRTLSLAIRLFGNVMSGSLVAGILLSVAPLFVPVIMQALGLLIGQIQAYIFAVLATVYIASAVRAHNDKINKNMKGDTHE
ncbi:MAG: F0F1 ATP synthase subunit A [Spirochaetales bacterium]|nr:F0F1 ATP synthase subunit A [Spirochaetales bacterium]